MTIEDAVTHHVWAAMASSGKAQEEHRQQAEWLSELVQVREENAKLRGLAYKAWKAAEQICQAFEGPCDDDGTHDKPCPLGEHRGCIYGQLKWKLLEAGIEVDG